LEIHTVGKEEQWGEGIRIQFESRKKMEKREKEKLEGQEEALLRRNLRTRKRRKLGSGDRLSTSYVWP